MGQLRSGANPESSIDAAGIFAAKLMWGRKTPVHAIRNGAVKTNGAAKSNWLLEWLLFAKNFLKHPNMLGWFLPSSPFVAETVLRQADWAGARVIIEYGPGVGTFTHDILRRMRPDATLAAFETNGGFDKFLSGAIRDPRFHLLHQSAAEIEAALGRLGLPAPDYAISGIPFRTLPEETRGEIVRKTHAALRPAGQFLVYQLTSFARPYLQRVFGRAREDFELLNIPPGRMFYCAR